MILVVPIGAEQYPISHGTTQYIPYRADHTDNSAIQVWLVDIPNEHAHYFMHNAGFYPWKNQER
jgi:hypothetical protein